MPSTPVRFGGGQVGVTERELFLKVFGGQVFAAFKERVLTLDKHQRQTITSGKEAQFPKTWKATSAYHTPGVELLGDDIDTTEITVSVDGLLTSHVGIYDLDNKMSHFDVMAEFSNELGQALARAYDKNVMRSIILAARTAADGPFPAGNVITNAALTNSGTIDGGVWVEEIRAANIALFNKDVPEDMVRYMLVNANVFDAIKYAKDADGHYLVLNRDFNQALSGAAAGVAVRGEFLIIDGVIVFKQRTIPSTNETADTSVYTKYRANYSTTTGVMWCPQAVGTVELIGVNVESERDARRQEDFTVAKMAVGHGTLRPECAVEFKTS